MEHGAFRAWLAEVDDLTADQRLELEEVLAGRTPRAAVTAAIEGSLGDERRRPHCGDGASVGCGAANGVRRFRCKKCGKSFNALTGAPLAGLRKEGALARIRPVAERGRYGCRLGRTLWRGGQHRFPVAPSLSYRQTGRSEPDRHRRGRRSLRAAQLQGLPGLATGGKGPAPCRSAGSQSPQAWRQGDEARPVP